MFQSYMNFLFPFILFTLPLGAGLLLLIYRRKSHGEPLRIPTLFLLKKFVSEGGKPRKVLPPPRFFFELLLLLILTLAAAGLTKKSGGKRSILIIDNSFQTSAQTETSRRIFDSVTDRAREALRTTLASDTVLVLATSPRQTSISDGFVPSDTAARLISSVTPTYATGDLELTISSALNRSDVDRVIVASAQPIEAAESDRDRLLLLGIGLPPLQNIAIEKMWQATGSEISVLLRSFSSSQSDVLVSLSDISSSGAFTSQVQKKVTIVPGKSAMLTFPSPPGIGVGYQAQIESPDVGPENAIAGDDQFWLSRTPPSSRIGVVSHIPLRDLNLDRVLGSLVEEISPSALEDNLDSKSGWIFHRTSPSRPTGKPTLLILPPSDSPIIRSTPFTTPWNVGIWESSSPLFRYLSPDTLKGSGGSSLTTSSSFTSLMRGEKGTLLAESFQYDTHTIALGFEALPFLGSKNAPLSILFLNIIKHLFPNAAGVELHPFSSIGEKNSNQIRYILSSPQLSGSEDLNNLPVPGLITTSPAYQAPKVRSETIVSVNYFDESQSNLLARRPTQIPVSTFSSTSRNDLAHGSSLVTPLIITLLLLMVGDGLLSALTFVRSRRRTT